MFEDHDGLTVWFQDSQGRLFEWPGYRMETPVITLRVQHGQQIQYNTEWKHLCDIWGLTWWRISRPLVERPKSILLSTQFVSFFISLDNFVPFHPGHSGVHVSGSLAEFFEDLCLNLRAYV